MPIFRNATYLGDKISFWNRREVHISQSLEEFNKIREILESKKIKYAYRQVGQGGFDFSRSLMYYIYVHSEDVEAAEFLIRRV